MKKLITSFLLLLCVSVMAAQTITDDYYGSPVKPKLLSKDRVSVSLSAGTGVSFSNNSTSFTTFVAPKINYQLTQKFRLNIGMMHYTATPNTAFLLNRNEAIVNGSNKNISGNLIMIGGDYQLNKRLIMSGSVMTDVNSLSKKQDNFKAATLGFEYKLAEHSTIKFETTISNGQGNYYSNPFPNSSFSNSMFDNSFSNSPVFR